MATSTLAGMAPASLKTLMRSLSDSVVPLHFQFPPMRYCLVPSAAGSPVEEPGGLLLHGQKEHRVRNKRLHFRRRKKFLNGSYFGINNEFNKTRSPFTEIHNRLIGPLPAPHRTVYAYVVMRCPNYSPTNLRALLQDLCLMFEFSSSPSAIPPTYF